jgi:SAM-dependent methyltransferase
MVMSIRQRGPFSTQMRRLWRFSTSAEYRYDALWRIFTRPRGLFQPYSTTFDDRYPDLFTLARTLAGDGPDRRILSFGCSTGEEVFSLRRYFPQASIVGVDINPRRIRLARRNLRRAGGNTRIAFAVANSAEHLEAASFDAIFCLAVFRHEKLKNGPAVRCDPLIHFADFERAVTDLARCLRPGGLLVLRNSYFRFRDTLIAERFDVVGRFTTAVPYPDAPLYDRNDRLMPSMAEDQAVFRLRSAVNSDEAAAGGPNQKV